MRLQIAEVLILFALLLYQPGDGREGRFFLLCDNCTGQKQLYDTIPLMACPDKTAHKDLFIFSGIGHTKFVPDWCFGLFKSLFRRSKVGSINDIAKVVNCSAQCNVTQLICNEDS